MPMKTLWGPMIEAMDRASAAAPPRSVAEVAALMHALTGDALAVTCDPTMTLPWGRYLVHADPAGRYNVQLDVFSGGYEGAIHGHGTWGIFWVLQGALMVRDFELALGTARAQRAARIGAGGAQCFCPPVSDWHQVATPAEGPQTVSLHLYGPGFDLDEGVYFAEMTKDGAGPTPYRRGPLGDPARVLPGLRVHAGRGGSA